MHENIIDFINSSDNNERHKRSHIKGYRNIECVGGGIATCSLYEPAEATVIAANVSADHRRCQTHTGAGRVNAGLRIWESL